MVGPAPPPLIIKEVEMRALVYGTVFAFAIALGVTAGAADKPAKAEKAAKAEKSDKKAGGEVTLSGEMVCAKCALHESPKCQNVLKVTDAGKETKYYLAQNEVAKSNHEHVCSAPEKATVTGKVSDEGGKKVLTASEIKFDK
jgi:hypothetical protein